MVQCGVCHHRGGPYGNQKTNGVMTSKAMLGLDLDGDYQSLEKHEGKPLQAEAAAVQKHRGV